MTSNGGSDDDVVDVRPAASQPPFGAGHVVTVADVWRSADSAPNASDVVGALGDLVVVVDAAGRIASCNAVAAAASGRQLADLIGVNVIDIVHPDDQRLAAELYDRYTNGSEVFRPALRLMSPSGRSVTVECVARRLEHASGPHLLISGRVDPLLDSEDLVESLRVGVMICDAAGVVTRSNETAAALLGTEGVEPRGPAEELPGKFFEIINGTWQACEHPLVTVLRTDRMLESRMVLVAADGRRRVVDVAGRPVAMRFTGAAAAVLTLTDVTDRYEVETELERRATLDDLTGVLNRSTFIARATEMIERTTAGRRIALLFCDLDRFKSINERFGHAEADRLLQMFASNALEVVGPDGLVGRPGGDEFAIAVEVSGPPEVEVLAGRLRGAVRRAGLSTIHVAVTSSIGVSLTSGPGEPDNPMLPVGQLMEEADEALRRAKRTGRDRSKLFDQEMRAQRAHQTAMSRMLRDRLDAGQVEVAVQPVVDPRTGYVSGGEVLARIRDDDGQLIAAGEWIESAVRTGLLGAVDEAVVRMAAQLLASFNGVPHAQLPVIGVNLSDAVLARPDLEAWLLGVLDAAGADPTGFLVEIPETVFPVIRDRAADALRAFSSHGIWIAVDDFGTGYASLAEVRDLPVDTLKIDRSFAAALPGTPEAAILRASIEMARALGCKTVAEGIETDEQLAHVVELGADYVQGFRLGRPMSPDDFVVLCDRQPST
ncbi:MAG: putative bifunctional diguanylate cyclase/phosphodiesterase [Actinomycetes bacterium]